jgi:Uma2 family endonuclease
MPAGPKSHLSPEEYLAIERQSDYRSEYFAGEMFAMSGASEAHNIIAGNLFFALRLALAGKSCQSYISDMRVRIARTGLYTYPDVVVVCGERLFDDTENDTLLNPTLIIEVLSPSTEAYDRGRKFEHYASIPSLQEYVLVNQDQPSVQLYQRIPGDSWRYISHSGIEATVNFTAVNASLALAVNASLALADIYEGITFS